MEIVVILSGLGLLYILLRPTKPSKLVSRTTKSYNGLSRDRERELY
jgi:hypothetical protein